MVQCLLIYIICTNGRFKKFGQKLYVNVLMLLSARIYLHNVVCPNFWNYLFLFVFAIEWIVLLIHFCVFVCPDTVYINNLLTFLFIYLWILEHICSVLNKRFRFLRLPFFRGFLWQSLVSYFMQVTMVTRGACQGLRILEKSISSETLDFCSVNLLTVSLSSSIF